MTAKSDNSGFIQGTNIPKPLLFEVTNYAEIAGMTTELAEQFYWHYESVGWVFPNGSVMMNWRAGMRKWAVQNRIFDKQKKERDEARAKAQVPPKTGDVLIDGQWWNDYSWYQKQVLESPKAARNIINIKHNGKAYFRLPNQ